MPEQTLPRPMRGLLLTFFGREEQYPRWTDPEVLCRLLNRIHKARLGDDELCLHQPQRMLEFILFVTRVRTGETAALADNCLNKNRIKYIVESVNANAVAFSQSLCSKPCYKLAYDRVRRPGRDGALGIGRVDPDLAVVLA